MSNIEYGPGARNQMDIYLPANPKGAPVVIFVHGGRWMRNDKSQVELYDRIRKFNDAGFVLVSFNYTYATEKIWPAQLDDTLSVIAFVRAQAESIGYDADRIALYGQSSGAHLALMAALKLAETPGDGVDAVVSWYAPSDLYNIAADRAGDDVPDRDPAVSGLAPEDVLLGVSTTENKAAADAASPVPYLLSMANGAKLPPLLIVHGDADTVVSPLQSERLYQAWRAYSGDGGAKLRYVKGGGHGGARFENEPSIAIAFLKAHLEKPD
ncbi:MAG: alpha/beta hydrolase [Hyphomonas sp.]|uniref:alpha/beta fold hydrolase n=1 Tax=Hyphomonas sp. TaxID=87 RepID=UPI003526EC4B